VPRYPISSSVRAKLDQVPLADLGVVEVEHQPQTGPVDGFDQGQGICRPGERHAGVVDGGVQVLQAKGHPGAFAEVGHPRQRPVRRQPHRAGNLGDRPDRSSLGVELGAVQIEARAAEPFRDRNRVLRGADERLRAVLVDQAAMHVPRHRGEPGAGAGQGVDVARRPGPNLDLVAEVGDPSDPLLNRQVEKNHLGADGQLDRRLLRTRFLVLVHGLPPLLAHPRTRPPAGRHRPPASDRADRSAREVEVAPPLVDPVRRPTFRWQKYSVARAVHSPLGRDRTASIGDRREPTLSGCGDGDAAGP
jgi:hypothetical protein